MLMNTMPKIDPKSRAIIDFVRSRLKALPKLGRYSFAKSAKVDPATITRLTDDKEPNYHPLFGTVFRILTELVGKPPLKISDGELLSNLPTYAMDEMLQKLTQGVKDLEETDIDLLFQFLAVVKNRRKLKPKRFFALTGALDMLQDELFREEERLVGPLLKDEEAEKDKLN